MKLVSSIMEGMEGIHIIYVVVLLLFIALFIVIVVRTIRRPKDEMNQIKESIFTDNETDESKTT